MPFKPHPQRLNSKGTAAKRTLNVTININLVNPYEVRRAAREKHPNLCHPFFGPSFGLEVSIAPTPCCTAWV